MLAEHEPGWADRFASEAEQLREALGDVLVQIEHVGSTAVPGLAAKPTIDIAAGTITLDLPAAAVGRLEALGYADAGDDAFPGERRFRKGMGVPWEVIVHVVEWGGPMWGDSLRFRDALRADPSVAREYEALKRRLLEERGEWYRGKDKQELIERVLASAPDYRFARSSSPEETEALAADVAHRLVSGDVVTVSGELGSGKTTFVRGACRELGVTVPVTSPTFTIGHRYPAEPVDVSHLDLYRFQGFSAAEWGDLEPYFQDAICFVEWPEAAAGALPPPRVEVRLSHMDRAHRLITLASPEPTLLDHLCGGADTRV
jgi:tRNA threonylcarbamoyladenosine biosynthesis protein TsaE